MLGSLCGLKAVLVAYKALPLGSSVFFQFWSADLMPRVLAICKMPEICPPSKPYILHFQASQILAEAVNIISAPVVLLFTPSREGF